MYVMSIFLWSAVLVKKNIFENLTLVYCASLCTFRVKIGRVKLVFKVMRQVVLCNIFICKWQNFEYSEIFIDPL